MQVTGVGLRKGSEKTTNKSQPPALKVLTKNEKALAEFTKQKTVYYEWVNYIAAQEVPIEEKTNIVTAPYEGAQPTKTTTTGKVSGAKKEQTYKKQRYVPSEGGDEPEERAPPTGSGGETQPPEGGGDPNKNRDPSEEEDESSEEEMEMETESSIEIRLNPMPTKGATSPRLGKQFKIKVPPREVMKKTYHSPPERSLQEGMSITERTFREGER